MATGEIKITDYTMSDCKGNLKTLISEWEGAPKVSTDVFQQSSGHTATDLLGCLESTAQVTTSMNTLLSSTLAFFESVGAAFEETEQEATKNINSVTSYA